MIDLRRNGLPNAIQVGGEVYRLNTDYRVWMSFPEIVEQLKNLGPEDDLQTYASLFYDYENIAPISNETVGQLGMFFQQKKEVPRDAPSGENLLDYDIDADYIYAAFMQTYGIDLVDADLHWHKFQALLNGLPGDTTLSAIMSYRSYSGSDKDMKEQKYRWSLPIRLTEEERKQKEAFDEMFG